MYNVWIDQPGKHGLTYWGKDKATGQRYVRRLKSGLSRDDEFIPFIDEY